MSNTGIMPYPNLQTALRYFKGQVYVGVPYAKQNLPRFKTPKELFDWFKPRTTYVKDPENRELFQCLPTLFENNFHGITGGGDCDCYSIGVITAMVASGFKKFGIVLVGDNPINARHIYAWADWNGERQYIDLTNNVFNYERYYPYRQELQFYYN